MITCSWLIWAVTWAKTLSSWVYCASAMIMLSMIFDQLLVNWLSKQKRITVEQLAFSDEASLQCLCPGLFPWNPAIRNLTKEKGTRWEKRGGQKELKVKNFHNIWRPILIFMLKLSSWAKATTSTSWVFDGWHWRIN